MLDGYTESIAVFFAINVLMAFSLYFPMKAGLISLGQGGFMAIGAYGSTMLTLNGVPFLAALLTGGLLSALFGAIVAAPAIRIRGIYLIILTLGFGEMVRIFFLNFPPTGGAAGVGGIRPETTLPAVTVACVIVTLLAIRLRRVRFGRAMLALHEDDLAARAMGINMTRVKLVAFMIGAAVAGVAGGFYAHQALFIDPGQFGFHRSADAFLYLVLGGPANPFGPVIGAAVASLVPEFFRFAQEWRMTFFGVVLVVLSIWRPNGLVGAARVNS